MVSEPRRPAIAPSSIDGDARRRDALADPAGESRGALAVEIAFKPVADRFVEQHAGPAGAEHDRHLAGRRGDRFEVDQRLGQARCRSPGSTVAGSNKLVVEVAAAEPVIAGFAAVAVLGDDLHVEPHQRPDVGGDEAVGADDVDHAPAARKRDADLRDARVAGAGGGVDLLAQRDLVGERDRGQRIVRAVHRLVGPRRRRGRQRRRRDRAASASRRRARSPRR